MVLVSIIRLFQRISEKKLFDSLSVHFVPVLSKRNNNKKANLEADEELKNISQTLFDVDENNFLSYVTVNYQGFLNATNSTEDRAPDSYVL